ncbi:platelet-activating factor acetylhydrolase IB subunit [Anatilimnocola floriformis]|uniref:platelet-activating factor acetylhydrolase IB subunit n=1 Tax=Anatilimnocola floriformis TaxID=2948575 RepID=UPI0020C25E65|nr:platelet-activating factor acetylhydrolase IB subunit [Anatilimnocola floriformis]
MMRAVLSCCVLSLVLVSRLSAEDAAVPAQRTREYSWMKVADWNARHDRFLQRAKEGKCDLLFLGDSITEGWGNNDTWKKFYTPRNAVNFGIGGDTTQNVHWRMTNGELEGLSPKAIVLMIGTNNFGLHNDKPEDVIRGVEALVKTLRTKLPDTEILLLGMFPRDNKPDTDFRKRIKTANEGIAKLADDKSIFYLDIGSKFLTEDGTLEKEIMPDYLHLSPKGYEIWAEAIEPSVKKLLGE